METTVLKIRSKEKGFSFKKQIERRVKEMKWINSIYQLALGLLLSGVLLLSAHVALAGSKGNGAPQNPHIYTPAAQPKPVQINPIPESKINPEPTKNPTNQGDLVPAPTSGINPQALRPNVPAINIPESPRYTAKPCSSIKDCWDNLTGPKPLPTPQPEDSTGPGRS